MANGLGIIIGITLVSSIVVFLDWWGRRKDRQSAKHTS